MNHIKAISLSVFLLAAVTANAQTVKLTKVWETDSTLKVPESVLYYPAGKVLFVSNVDGKPHEKDLKGSISLVGLDGKIIKQDWATNLSAPKGMGFYNGELYVTDIGEVAVLDIKTGKLIKRIPITGAVFLNDITVDKNGIVYVSDSRTGTVHKIQNSTPSIYIKNKMGVNGLLSVDDNLYLAVKDTLYKADKSKKLVAITTGMDDSSDGIVQNGNDFIISCWNGIIYSVKPDGSKQELLDTRAQKSNTADVGFDPATKTLYVPTFFKNKVVAYKVN